MCALSISSSQERRRIRGNEIAEKESQNDEQQRAALVSVLTGAIYKPTVIIDPGI